MNALKHALIFSLILGGMNLINPPLHAQVNAPLNDDQSAFVQAFAPDFVSDKYCDYLDRCRELNYDGDWKMWNNEDNEKSFKKSPTAVYYDYYETAGFVVVSYMAYRPFNEVPGFNLGIGNHIHDTEDTILVFRKDQIGSSQEKKLADLNPKLVAVLALSHYVYIAAATEQKYETNLPRNFANMSKASFLTSLMKALTGGVKDDNGIESSRVIQYNIAKTLDDLNAADTYRSVIYTEWEDHAMVPVTNIHEVEMIAAKATKDSYSGVVFYPENTKVPSNMRGMKPISYKLIPLAPIITGTTPLKSGKTIAQTILNQNHLLAAKRAKDIADNVIIPLPGLCRDLQDSEAGLGDCPLSFTHGFVPLKESAGMTEWSQIKPTRRSMVDIGDFLASAFKNLAKPEDLPVVHNPYYVEKKK